MIKLRQNFTISLLVFIFGVLLSSIVLIIPGLRFLTWAILIISMVYLVTGPFIFKKVYPEGHPLVLFLMGYLYSGVFIAVVFQNTGWPLVDIFIGIAPIWAIIQMIVVLVIRKKLLMKAFVQLIIESCILLILAIIMLFTS